MIKPVQPNPEVSPPTNNSILSPKVEVDSKLSLNDPDKNLNTSSSSRKSTSSSECTSRKCPKQPLTPSSALYEGDDDVKSLVYSDKDSTNIHNTPPRENTTTDSLSKDNSGTIIDNVSSTPNSEKVINSRRFSFNKRPVSFSSKLQRKSSQISFINNYPPQRCDSIKRDIDHSKFYSKFKGIMKDKDELPDSAINDLSFEYNYDEKIRAPRMSVVSFISKASSINSQQQNHFNATRQTSAPVLLKTRTSSSNHTLESLSEEASYQPASFDLTKQLRHFSIGEDAEKVRDEINTPFNDAYTYNITKTKSRISNSSSNVSPTKEKASFLSHEEKPPKQIEAPTRLAKDYIPPVLRPIPTTSLVQIDLAGQNDSTKAKSIDHVETTPIMLNSNVELNTPPSSSSTLDSGTKCGPKKGKVHYQLFTQLSNRELPKTPVLKTTLGENPSISEALLTASVTNSSFYSPKKTPSNLEPSHSHWKPNCAVSACESCGSSFNLFHRKHHCRHCGGIFCSNCLGQFANLNLLGNFEKPESLVRSALLSPIQSTETCATFGSNKTFSQRESSQRYSTFCKVCPECSKLWIQFLASDEDYEGKILLEQGGSTASANLRKESLNAVPSDWNWSSF